MRVSVSDRHECRLETFNCGHAMPAEAVPLTSIKIGSDPSESATFRSGPVPGTSRRSEDPTSEMDLDDFLGSLSDQRCFRLLGRAS